jgi:hypothetical protein
MLVPFENLWLPAFFVAVLGTWLLWRGLKLNFLIALALSAAKAAIPFLYFAYFFDGSWNLLDDVTYFRLADSMLAEGRNPFLIFFTVGGLDQLYAAGGNHFLYYWWNLLAIYVFGPFYSSPVFLNVATTFLSAFLLARIVRISGCAENYSKWLAIFFLFHWDILTWSSFVNLKDTIVLMLTLLATYSGIRLVQQRNPRWAIPLVATCLVFLSIRYYIPVLMLFSFGVWIAFAVKGLVKIPLILLAAVGTYLIFPQGSFQTFQDLREGGWISGPVRMALTPQPWRVGLAYSHLEPGAFLHWALFIPAIITAARLSLKNRVFRFAAFYYAVLIVFYGLLPEFATPRERVQISWVLAWAQFHLIWYFLSETVGHVKRLIPLNPLKVKHVHSVAPDYRSARWRRRTGIG